MRVPPRAGNRPALAYHRRFIDLGGAAMEAARGHFGRTTGAAMVMALMAAAAGAATPARPGARPKPRPA
ncbi:hypothetical protein, partial [Lysobacter enzymogenes]|uniref:hypothetical protein n=1 Tax=Lysobacter enzymogenes TaxID=69 RepID=UPI0019D14263